MDNPFALLDARLNNMSVDVFEIKTLVRQLLNNPPSTPIEIIPVNKNRGKKSESKGATKKKRLPIKELESANT